MGSTACCHCSVIALTINFKHNNAFGQNSGEYKVNFKELSAKIAENNGITKAKAESIVREIFETITNELTTEGEVSIHGFGRFTTRKARARLGRNINTGVEVTIPEKVVAKFVVHSALKAAIAAQ